MKSTIFNSISEFPKNPKHNIVCYVKRANPEEYDGYIYSQYEMDWKYIGIFTDVELNDTTKAYSTSQNYVIDYMLPNMLSENNFTIPQKLFVKGTCSTIDELVSDSHIEGECYYVEDMDVLVCYTNVYGWITIRENVSGVKIIKKVYISQPMRDLDDKEIKQIRINAIQDIKSKLGDDIEIIDSYFEDYNPTGGSIPLKYLSKSIELLADADIVYFCRDWATARGCKIEHQCAVEYGIERIYE